MAVTTASPPVVNGVPQAPDLDEPLRKPPAGVVVGGLLLVVAFILVALGWVAGMIWRVVSWIAAALAVGFDSGRGR